MQKQILPYYLRRVLPLVILVISVVITMGSFLRPHFTSAATGINEQINYQGRLLTDTGAVVPDGNYNIEFKIYCGGDGVLGSTSGDCTNGTTEHLYWTETRESTDKVPVRNGYFSVYLGSVNPFGSSVNWNEDKLWLSVNIGSTGSPSYDGEMSPFTRFGALPYALNSKYLGGLASSAFGQLASNQTWTGTNTLQPTTNITTAVIKQTSAGSPTADILNIQTANTTSILQITGPAANEAAVTLNSVGATRALTLDSGSGIIVLGSNTTTLQKSGTAFTFDVTSGSSSTLTITNSGAGVASLSVEGNITTSGTIGTASTTTFTGAGATFSSAVAANGGITFDNTTDTLGAYTLAGTVDASTNIITNIGNTGTDFVAATGALTLAGVLTANGGITVAANQDITTTAGTGTLTLNNTVTNASENAILITPSYTGGATDTLTYNGIAMAAFSPTNAAGTDTVNGVNLGNLTDPGATIESNAIFIGSGWDSAISTVASSVGATANSLVISNNATTPINLLEVRDLTANTNQFGSLAIADAFISRQSYYGQEFNVIKGTAGTGCGETPTGTAISIAQQRGDGYPGTAATPACQTVTNTVSGMGDLTTSSVASGSNNGERCDYYSNNAANGYETIKATGTASRTESCLETNGTTVAGTQQAIFNSGNLPQIVMKVRTSVLNASNNAFYAGVSNKGVLTASPPMAAANKGFYFSNCSNPITPVCNAGGGKWYGYVQDGTTNPPTSVTCPANDNDGTAGMSITNFSYLRIEVRKATTATNVANDIEVQFFVDYDVTDGIHETSCGTITQVNNFGTSVGLGALLADYTGNATASSLDVDYFRVWQDDAPSDGSTPRPTLASSTQNGNAPSVPGQEKQVLASEVVNTIPMATTTSPSKLISKSAYSNLMFVVFAVGIFILLIYRNHLSQKEIKRLSSPQHVAAVIQSLLTDKQRAINISSYKDSLRQDRRE